MGVRASLADLRISAEAATSPPTSSSLAVHASADPRISAEAATSLPTSSSLAVRASADPRISAEAATFPLTGSSTTVASTQSHTGLFSSDELDELQRQAPAHSKKRSATLVSFSPSEYSLPLRARARATPSSTSTADLRVPADALLHDMQLPDEFQSSAGASACDLAAKPCTSNVAEVDDGSEEAAVTAGNPEMLRESNLLTLATNTPPLLPSEDPRISAEEYLAFVDGSVRAAVLAATTAATDASLAAVAAINSTVNTMLLDQTNNQDIEDWLWSVAPETYDDSDNDDPHTPNIPPLRSTCTDSDTDTENTSFTFSSASPRGHADLPPE